MKVLLWDWNGTLLNDVVAALHAFNDTIDHFGLAPIDLAHYREIYRHPVISMYRDVGFDDSLHSYDELCALYARSYASFAREASLHQDSHVTLRRMAESGHRQSILSALGAPLLTEAVAHHGLGYLFEKTFGTDDNRGQGKIALAHRAAQELGVSGREIMIIGDSSHDADVARALRADCVLVGRGFESAHRLHESGFPVLDSFADLPRYIQ